MGSNGIISLLIIINTCIFSIQGFKNRQVVERFKFSVDRFLVHKEYWRIITSGLVHLNWMHLILNMFVLLLIGTSLEAQVGPIRYLLVYIAGLAGSDLFSLIFHRKHGSYTSIGASGAINAVLFASIVIFPHLDVFFLPGWLFGLLYVLYSIYGIKSNRDNIGHESHLGGALAGIVAAVLLYPEIVLYNYIAILATVIPISVFIYLVITRPQFLMVDNFFFKKQIRYTIDEEYNLSRRKKELQLDEILDKIQKKGMNNLTKDELRKLKEYSQQL